MARKYYSPFTGLQADESVDKVTRIEWDAVDAIVGANSPSAINVFATVADLAAGAEGTGLKLSASAGGSLATYEFKTQVSLDSLIFEDLAGMVNTSANAFTIPITCDRAIIAWNITPQDPTVGHIYLSECYRNDVLVGSSRRSAANFNAAAETIGPIFVSPGDLITFKVQTGSPATSHNFTTSMLCWASFGSTPSNILEYTGIGRNVRTYQASGLEAGTFGMPVPNSNINAVDVWLNGIKLARTDEYTLSGGNVVISMDVLESDDIEIHVYSDADRYSKLFTAGEDIPAYNVCYLAPDGKMWRADATTQETSASLVTMTHEGVSSGSEAYFTLFGEMDGFSSLTVGAPYFISTTVGGITLTPPYASGEIVKLVGYALSDTKLLFYPSKTWTERI